MTTSEINLASDGHATSDVLLGAAGNSGRLIAAELAARGLSLRLAGRRPGPLMDLAQALATHGAAADPRTVDAGDAASLAAVALVTGAGFGPAATETLVLRLAEQLGAVPDLVRVAAAAGVTRQSDGVRQTIEESLSEGVAVMYRDGQVVREALGSGATVVTFGGAKRQVLPGPVGDLETARLASGAANVVAYIPNPTARSSATDSYTWAEVSRPGGQTASAELHTGEGVRATAAIAAETAERVLAGVKPGAWTAGQLFGAALVPDATGARVTVHE